MVDTTKVEQDILAEKARQVSELEARLQEYQKKEVEAEKAKLEAKNSETLERLKKLEEEKEAMKVSFEEKLNKVSQRISTPNSNEDSDKLTVEKLKAMTEAERIPYFTKALKAGKNMDGIFFN